MHCSISALLALKHVRWVQKSHVALLLLLLNFCCILFLFLVFSLSSLHRFCRFCCFLGKGFFFFSIAYYHGKPPRPLHYPFHPTLNPLTHGLYWSVPRPTATEPKSRCVIA